MIAAMPLITASCIDEEGENYIGLPTELARFVISVGNEQGGSSYSTKQTTEVTQAQSSPVFRGMQDMVMIPFHINGDEVTSSDNRVYINITLPAVGSIPLVGANNTISSSLNAGSNSQVYQDVTIAQGTNAFLCYGKATGDDNMANGSLDYTGLEDSRVSDIQFSPKAIYTTETPTIAPAGAKALTDYLTSIANTTGWVDGDNGKLPLLHKSFTSQHAGSSANVLATLRNLYDAIDLEVGTLRDAIMASMKIGDATDDVLHHDSDGKLQWNDSFAGKEYPASIGLPDGAAYITWNSTDPENPFFESDINGTSDNVGNDNLGTNSTVADLQHYSFPAPLYYRANTKIKVSNDSQLEHYQEGKTWEQILNYYNTGDGTVRATTHSIALKDPLQYAVARLDIAVKADNSTLQDKIDVETNASDLQLTGVLINGQRAVDYSFTPKSTDDIYTIYDNTINKDGDNNPITLETNRGKAEASYAYNHTLVLPSPKNENVNVYLEFQNNSDHDITTEDGSLVPPGCKLYLAGTITLGSGQDYVFEQDKVTKFIATISNLKNACNVVPDMNVGKTFIAHVAIKDWTEIIIEDHDIFNW